MTTLNGARRFHPTLLAALIVVVALACGAHSACAQFGAFGAPRPPSAGGIFSWVFAKQALFYRALSGLIRAAKTDGSACWGLMGVSFVYGIFHAAGPGHGKAVISSYLFANEETWRRGVTLSFASAMLQSVVAVAIVAIAAFLIGATAKMMGDTVRGIEIVSYALIIVVGARLLWVKGRSFFSTLRKVRAQHQSADTAEVQTASHHAYAHAHAHGHAHPSGHAHCDHHEHSHDQNAHGPHEDHAHAAGHAHDHDEEENVLPWGHAHGPEPEELAGPDGWRRGLWAIVAVGLRPCSGAIIILVFALAQGLFWAGVASTFVMGLGTAITVGAIATLAVGAKALARRVAATRAGYGSLALRGIEVGAAVLVMLFGVLLVTGYMASERMGMF